MGRNGSIDFGALELTCRYNLMSRECQSCMRTTQVQLASPTMPHDIAGGNPVQGQEYALVLGTHVHQQIVAQVGA